MHKYNNKRVSGGFTLVELLVVIAIIGTLASIVLAALGASRIKAQDARRASDLHELASAISLYESENQSLPGNQTGWCTYISNPTDNAGDTFQGALAPRYISKISHDPQYGPSSGDYFYINEGNTNGKFTLCAIMQTEVGQDYTSQYGSCAGWSSSYNYCISR